MPMDHFRTNEYVSVREYRAAQGKMISCVFAIQKALIYRKHKKYKQGLDTLDRFIRQFEDGMYEPLIFKGEKDGRHNDV